MDGMKETKAEMADIIDIIDGLKLTGVLKHHLLYWVQEKKKGNEKAREILCKLAITLYNAKTITPEQHAQIIVYAWQKEQRPSGSGLWTRCSAWLKRFFS